MPTRIGTSYFASKGAAVKYYRDYGYTDVKSAVERKLTDGEISLGSPPTKEGYSVRKDADNRYYYEETATPLCRPIQASRPEYASREHLRPRRKEPEPVLPRIRFIVHTVTSEVDRNGNSYHVATVRSTVTGKLLAVTNVGGTRNVPGQVMRASGDWEHQGSSESTLPKREYRALEKRLQAGDNCVIEHLLTAEMILALEK